MKKTLGLMIFLATVGASAEETAMTLPPVQTTQMSAMEKNADLEISDPAWKFQIGHVTADYSVAGTAKGKGLAIGMGYEFSRLFGVSASFANLKNDYALMVYDYSVGAPAEYKYSDNTNLYTGAVEFTPMRYDYKDLAFRAALLLGVVSLRETGRFYGASMTLSLNKQIGLSLDTKVQIKTANASSSLDSLNQISLVGYY